MSSINGVGNNSPIQKVGVPVPTKSAVPAHSDASPSRPSDKLDLSGTSHLLQTLKTNNIRADKVASIKAQIQNGTYDEGHKLDVATDRMLDDILK